MNMERRRNHTKRHRTNPRSAGRADNNDRISELPDDIKLVIFSVLGMKDVARTSVLSKKWRYSWTYNLDDLDFDVEKTLGVSGRDDDYHPVCYASWVNEVIKAHNSPTVRKFRIFHNLVGAFTPDINRWLNFCLGKGVQELELDCDGKYGNSRFSYFTFESMWQTTPSLTRDVSTMPTFTNLRSFRAVAIKISGPLLELMLSKCLLLERLSFRWCIVLGGLKVVGSSLKLKYLDFCVSEVDKVEISAPNLDTIVCKSDNGHLDHIDYKCVPSLVEATFDGYNAIKLVNQISCCSFQLEKLSIRSLVAGICSIATPRLDNLKQLTLTVLDGDNLLFLMYLLDACPSLRELNLQLKYLNFDSVKGRRRRQRKAKIYPCLEAVRMVGFDDCVEVLEFISYIVKNAPLLKSCTLDTRDLSILELGEEFPDDRDPCEVEKIRRFAGELSRKFPPSVDVVIV